VSGELLGHALLLGGLGSAAPGVFLGLLPGLSAAFSSSVFLNT